MQAAEMLDSEGNESEHGNPMRPWRR
jgi:hypothetical protein